MKHNEYPLITVRIPAYNHEAFVFQALESIRQQTYPNKEIVIIDDGSTDNTPNVIKSWINQYGQEVKIFFHTRRNKGISSTINELIDMSSGEFIAGIASDDYLLPESLKLRYEYLSNHSEKKAVFGDSQVVDENGKILHQSGLSDLHSANKDRYLTDKGLKKEIIQNWSVPGGTLMVRRALHSQVRYNEKLQIEDRDFYLRLVADNSLGFIDKQIAAYRIHGQNICFDKKNRFLSSLNKFRSLIWNIHRFSMREQLLFVMPILSSFLGMMVFYIQKKLNSNST